MKNKSWIGPLLQDQTRVIGVGNLPLTVKGRTNLLPFQWKNVEHKLSLLVIPTLEDPEVILGMDVMTQLGVQIDVRSREAVPTILPNYVRPMETWKIPPKKSVIFSLPNPVEHKRKILFEPSEQLPVDIRGTPTLMQGKQLHIRLENFGEEVRIINPEWVIGTLEVVEEEIIYEKEKKKRRERKT